MGEKSAISYCDATLELTSGCTRVSAGCVSCWAEALARGRLKHLYPQGFGHVTLHPERLDVPLKRRKPTVYFVCSRSDLFHKDVPTDFIEQAFIVMARSERHTFLVLTKRPDRMASFLANPGTKNFIVNRTMAEMVAAARKRGWEGPMPFTYPDWPLLNVWLGVSIENQATADERIPLLLETPGNLWLSVEPMLEAIHFPLPCVGSLFWSRIKGVVVGGESGPRFRPMQVEWVQSLVDQCQAAGVKCWVKQDSHRYPGRQGRLSAELWNRKEAPWCPTKTQNERDRTR